MREAPACRAPRQASAADPPSSAARPSLLKPASSGCSPASPRRATAIEVGAGIGTWVGGAGCFLMQVCFWLAGRALQPGKGSLCSGLLSRVQGRCFREPVKPLLKPCVCQSRQFAVWTFRCPGPLQGAPTPVHCRGFMLLVLCQQPTLSPAAALFPAGSLQHLLS